MRLVSKTTLYFQEGNSDKVYEVELCELGPDQFVVNFRYGRRGSLLKEGTKTEEPVSERKAQGIFDKLVASKEKKGYSADGLSSSVAVEETTVASSSVAPSSTGLSDEERARNRVLLSALSEGERSSRPLDRIIWRVGELGLPQAEPMLIELMGTCQEGQTTRIYCLLWALGRCGGAPAMTAIEMFREQANSSCPAHVIGIAYEALRMLGKRVADDVLLARLQSQQLAALPPKMASAVRTQDADALNVLLQDAITEGHRGLSETIVTLYRHGGEVVRAALCSCLRSLPLEYGSFSAVRTLFKAAEYRGDGEIFGIVAHRFETTKANRSYYYGKDQAFTRWTRLYLRKRVARSLRRLGSDSSSDFVPMAVGVLLPYEDISNRNIAANYLLFGQNEKHPSSGDGASGWMQAQVHKPIGTPNARQEAFPELWEQRPEALLHLIDGSTNEAVHRLSVAVLRDCPKFLANLDIDVLKMLVSARYVCSAELGFELVRVHPVDAGLAMVLCHSRLLEARVHAHQWLRLQYPIVDDSELWASLIMSAYSDNREFVRTVFRGALLPTKLEQLIVARVIGSIRTSDDSRDTSLFLEFVDILLTSCKEQASTLGEEVLRDLLTHSIVAVQEVGAQLLLHNRAFANSVPQDLLIALLESEHPSIRLVGTELLGKLPQSELSRYPELFVHLALHELEDLRLGAYETILRVAQHDSSFASAIALALSEALLRKLPKGAPANAILLLQSPELLAVLPAADQSHVMRLLRLKSPHARQLGLIYLGRLEAESFTLFDLVGLADHEMVAVRHDAWKKCKASVDRFRLTMPALARLLDAKWDDTRAFAIEFLETGFASDELGPAALIAICDSVRPEIQQLGQKLILEHFRDEDGQEYLAKLSEHPSTRLQNFVTNYLERYAADDLQKLSDLKHYFLSVLSRVNAGGVAKRRCLRFLEQEGLKSPAAAVVVGEILSRQSVTIAICNKASIISAMVALHAKYPDLELPIETVAPPTRGQEPAHAV
ncbi:MAG: WGR domain-containing protein [Kofleriaceae bacterium]|nr:WGR domain-containing protein [Kofleriaceae bacterium]